MNRRTHTTVAGTLSLLAAFCACTVASTGASRPYTVLTTEPAIAKAMDQCSRWTPPLEGSWTPSQDLVAQLEADLHRLHRQKARSCCLLGARLRDPQTYYRQYIGLVLNGRRVVYINAFADSEPPSTWQTDGVVYCDGGTGSWGAVYDPATRRFSDLAFNGVA